MVVATPRTPLLWFTVFVIVVHVNAKNEPLGPIREAIQNGIAGQYNRENCVWRRGHDRDSCPDPDVHVFLYTENRPRRELDSRESDWLRQDYDSTRENVLLVHGYAGA